MLALRSSISSIFSRERPPLQRGEEVGEEVFEPDRTERVCPGGTPLELSLGRSCVKSWASPPPDLQCLRPSPPPPPPPHVENYWYKNQYDWIRLFIQGVPFNFINHFLPSIDKFCEDYHIGRYHMDPELVQHVLWVDGKMIRFDGCGALQTAFVSTCTSIPSIFFSSPYSNWVPQSLTSRR